MSRRGEVGKKKRAKENKKLKKRTTARIELTPYSLRYDK